MLLLEDVAKKKNLQPKTLLVWSIILCSVFSLGPGKWWNPAECILNRTVPVNISLPLVTAEHYVDGLFLFIHLHYLQISPSYTKCVRVRKGRWRTSLRTRSFPTFTRTHPHNQPALPLLPALPSFETQLFFPPAVVHLCTSFMKLLILGNMLCIQNGKRNHVLLDVIPQ